MTDIKPKVAFLEHDFEYNSLKLSICIIDEQHHKNLREYHSLHRQTYHHTHHPNTHHHLWNEVLGIVETYAKKSQREIKQVYAVFNKDNDWDNLLNRNEDILYGFRHKININITELEKNMYYVVDKESIYGGGSYPEFELPILRDEYAYNYLIIEMIDDKYIIGRYGVNDVESYDFNNPQFYGYDGQTEFCDFDALPIEFKKPIEELKQKIKMIDDASTIGKVQKDDYIPDPQEGSREAWEYMNTPEYKRQIKIQQEQYLQSDEYNIVQNDKIVTDIKKPTNVIKQIDIRNPDITITTTKNNVVKTENTNSKINSEPEPYNSFPLGKITKLEKDLNDLQNIRNSDITITTTKNNLVKSEYTNSKINSEPEPYNSFPLGKITKLEKDLNDLQNKFKESVKLTENCLTSFINETIENKINKTITETINEVSLTTTKLRQFSGIIGLEYTIKDEDCNLITKLWTHEDVKELVKKWIRQRMVDNKTNLCVLLSNVETLMYCYEENVVEEPSIRVYGEIVRPNADIPDGEIKKTLLELFTYLKEELKQYSVRFNFQGYNENISIRIS